MSTESLIAEAVKAERQRCIQAALSAFIPHYMAQCTVRSIVERIDPEAVVQVEKVARQWDETVGQGDDANRASPVAVAALSGRAEASTIAVLTSSVTKVPYPVADITDPERPLSDYFGLAGVDAELALAVNSAGNVNAADLPRLESLPNRPGDRHRI